MQGFDLRLVILVPSVAETRRGAVVAVKWAAPSLLLAAVGKPVVTGTYVGARRLGATQGRAKWTGFEARQRFIHQFRIRLHDSGSQKAVAVDPVSTLENVTASPALHTTTVSPPEILLRLSLDDNLRQAW